MKAIFQRREIKMVYRLGCYKEDGSLERLRTVDNKEKCKTCVQKPEGRVSVYNLGSEDRVC